MYKTKYCFEDRFGNIDSVIELEHCEWKITDYTFNKERADYLVASMEELTGVKHYVIEVESENETEVETETAEDPGVSELIDQLIIDVAGVDGTVVEEQNDFDELSHELLTTVFDDFDFENSVEASSEIYDELLEKHAENLYGRST